jgi:hypothetical protein
MWGCTWTGLKIAEVSDEVQPGVYDVVAHQVADGPVANHTGGIQILDILDADQGRDSYGMAATGTLALQNAGLHGLVPDGQFIVRQLFELLARRDSRSAGRGAVELARPPSPSGLDLACLKLAAKAG